MNDLKYLQAIADIVANCGPAAKKLLTDDREKFREKKVCELAGTSPEYQRHVIDRALAGDTNPFRMIASTLLVYDTVRFGEVTSRLHRARGTISKEVSLLTRAIESGTTPNRLADRLLTLALIEDQASRLHDMLINLQTVYGTKKKHAATAVTTPPTERLYAPTGLGLVAKNVRNVAVLQNNHHPTPDQKQLAIRLTADILESAVAARDHAREKFGPADDACRVRPSRKPTVRVITHDKVDGDAVVSAWLAEKFLFAGKSVEVLFVPRGRVCGAYRTGDCLVDVGNTYDAKNYFFDHKPPALPNRHDSCAAHLIWDRLCKLGHPVFLLRPLINVVFAGDSARERPRYQEEYTQSQQDGFHRALTDAKGKHGADAEVYRVMRRWLDAHHRKTANQTG